MNPDELFDTAMNPETRVLMQVTLEDAAAAEEIFRVPHGGSCRTPTRVHREGTPWKSKTSTFSSAASDPQTGSCAFQERAGRDRLFSVRWNCSEDPDWGLLRH